MEREDTRKRALALWSGVTDSPDDGRVIERLVEEQGVRVRGAIERPHR